MGFLGQNAVKSRVRDFGRPGVISLPSLKLGAGLVSEPFPNDGLGYAFPGGPEDFIDIRIYCRPPTDGLVVVRVAVLGGRGSARYLGRCACVWALSFLQLACPR